MIWKWTINARTLHQIAQKFPALLSQGNFHITLYFTALVCLKDAPLAASQTPYNSASTCTGNPVKFSKRKAIIGFLREKAAC